MSGYLAILSSMILPAAVFLLAEKKSRAAAGKGALLTACAILLFFMALRGENVGADTKQYTAAFEQIRAMNLGECLTGKVYGASGAYVINLEPGYRLYNWILGRFFSHPQAVTAANTNT